MPQVRHRELDLEAVGAQCAAGGEDGGVIDQRRQREVQSEDLAGAFADRGQRGEVGDDQVMLRMAREVGEGGQRLAPPPFVPAQKDEAMPLVSEAPGRRKADPSVPSSDDNGIIHVHSVRATMTRGPAR